MSKVKLDLASKDNAQTLQFGNNVKTALTGNATFAALVPTPATLGTQLTAAQAKLTQRDATAMLMKQQTNELNVLMDGVRLTLTQMGHGVEVISGGVAASI